MGSEVLPSIRWAQRALMIVFWGAIFAVSYAQAPLYYSNQQQYFLHGLAQGGLGHLEHDWLANTEDPTPLFSQLVTVTYRDLDEHLFYLYYALIQAAYFFALWGVYRTVSGGRRSAWREAVFVILLLVIHSAVLRSASMHLWGVDYPWYFQAGLAGQYILGPVFQPSAFGTLLIISILLFARGYPFWAVTCSSVAVLCHSTYLLAGGLITLSYLWVLVNHYQARKALVLGMWGLLLVLPVIISNYLKFAPTSADLFAQAQSILVHFRIPHHAIPRLWCDEVAWAQIAWIGLGIGCAWGTGAFPILLFIALGATGLTLIQIATDNDTLALLFPWRLSAILMPICTALVFTRLVGLGGTPARASQGTSTPWVVAGVVGVALAVGGAWIMANGLAFQSTEEEQPLFDYVREHSEPSDVYLLPVRVPNLEATVSGSQKSDFKPIRAKREDVRLIPTDLQRFRLETGTPIYVDFKSIPYKDTEVLQWRERLRNNERWVEKLRAGEVEQVLPELREAGITHIVLRAEQPLESADLDRKYADEMYLVYQIKE